MFKSHESKFPFNSFERINRDDYWKLDRGNIQYVVEHFNRGHYVASTYSIREKLLLLRESPQYLTVAECLAFFDGLFIGKDKK